jgi:hypothetical protein
MVLSIGCCPSIQFSKSDACWIKQMSVLVLAQETDRGEQGQGVADVA